MKVAILILGILGSLLTVGLGAKWLSDFNKYKDTFAQIEKMSSQMPEGQKIPDDLMGKIKKTHNAAYALVGLGLLSFLSSLLVFKMPKLTGIIMLLTVIVPAVMTPQALVGSFLLIISGILAMIAKPKTA